MKHTVLVTISALPLLILPACAPSTEATADQAAATEEPLRTSELETQIAEVSATTDGVPTLAPTSTPIPPTKLAYTFSVLDPAARTLHIHLEITELHAPLPVLTFWTNAGGWSGDWIDPLSNAMNIHVADNAGNPLSYSVVDDGIPWTGDGLRIETQDADSLTVEYDMPLGLVDPYFTGDRQRLVAGYMNREFAVAEPEFLILAPVDVETTDYVMTVDFDISGDQVSATNWQALGNHSYSVDAREKAFSYGVLIFGQILSKEQTIGGTAVRVAGYGIDPATFEQIAENTFRIYQFYETTFGAYPIPAFALVYVPDVTDGLYIDPYNEQSGGFHTRYLPWYRSYWSDNIAHPVAHNWIGGGIHGEQWFQEGFVNYYELKSCEAIGLYSHSLVQSELAARLTRYSTEIIGTEHDLSLTEAADIFNRDHGYPYDFLTYEKGSLFAYFLDLEIARLSGGEKSLDDAIAVLWSQYMGLQQHNIGVAEVRRAVEEVTGQDFGPFFNAYVSGTAPLPLEVQQGEVVLGERDVP